MKNKKILIVLCVIFLVIALVVSGVVIHNSIKQSQYLEEQDALVNEEDINKEQENNGTNIDTNTEVDNNENNNIGSDITNYVIPKPTNPIKNTPVVNPKPELPKPILELDKVSPMVTLSVNGTNVFVKSIVTNIIATDNIAVSKIKYAVSTSNTVEPANYTIVYGSNTSVSFPAAGNNNVYYIWYSAVDIYGNSSGLKLSAPFKIDNELPIANINMQGTNYYVKTASAIITATDSKSTISKIMYKVVPASNPAGPDTYDEAINVSSVVVNFPALGDNAQYYIWYYTIDSANNASIPVRTTNTFKLDNAAPTVEISNQGTSTFVKNANATITAVDNKSTISKIMYKVVPVSNPAEPGIYDEATNVSDVILSFPTLGNNGEYYVWYYAIDALGNTSIPVRTANTFKIDNESPIATIDKQGTSSYVKTVSATITAIDSKSNISKIMYKVVPLSNPAQPVTYDEVSNTSSVTVNFPLAGDNAQYYIWYYAIDGLGNASAPVRTTNTFKLDNIAPQLDLVNHPIDITNNIIYNNDGNKHIDIEGIKETATNEPIDDVNLKVFLLVKDQLGNTVVPMHQLVAVPNPVPEFGYVYRSNYEYVYGTTIYMTLWVEDIAGNRTYIFNNRDINL